MLKPYKRAVNTFMISVFVALFISCKKKQQSSDGKNTSPAQPLPATVSFSRHIMPIFNSYCASSSCHSGNSPAANLNLMPGVAYNQLFARHEVDTIHTNNSVLYIEVASGDMPGKGSSLSSYNILLIQKWIQQKAKNN